MCCFSEALPKYMECSSITSVTVRANFHPNLSPYAHFGHTFRYAGRRHGALSAHTLCISHAFWTYHLIAVYESIQLVWWITDSFKEYIGIYGLWWYRYMHIRVRCGRMCVRVDVFGMWKKISKVKRTNVTAARSYSTPCSAHNVGKRLRCVLWAHTTPLKLSISVTHHAIEYIRVRNIYAIFKYQHENSTHSLLIWTFMVAS